MVRTISREEGQGPPPGRDAACVADGCHGARRERLGQARCLGKKATIVSGKKTIVGTKAPDVIVVLGGGTHTVHGLGGNDRICGGSGDDRLYGEKGSDRIDGGGGDDTILGDRGGDKLSGGAGDDYIDGQKGSDNIDGGGGTDHLLGDKGNDTMLGGPGDGDYLDGGLGDEKLEDGGPGNGDEVIGNLGSDNLTAAPATRTSSAATAATTRSTAAGATRTSPPSRPRPNRGSSSTSPPARRPATATTSSSTSTTSSAPPTTTRSTATRTPTGSTAGPATTTSTAARPSGGGDPDLGLGGPGADDCQSFGETSSCNDGSPAQKETAVELNRGLDGTSLVVTGLGDDSQITVTYGGGAFDGHRPDRGSRPAKARAASPPARQGAPQPARRRRTGTGEPTGPDTTATCTSRVGLSFVLIDAGGGNDRSASAAASRAPSRSASTAGRATTRSTAGPATT